MATRRKFSDGYRRSATMTEACTWAVAKRKIQRVLRVPETGQLCPICSLVVRRVLSGGTENAA
jgi:hypothetical protein